MKIRLINPAPLDPRGRPVRLQKEVMADLTLPYLAALIPGDHEIEIINEGLDLLDFSDPVDLVGITSITCRVPRAYWIADQYRARKIPVVMGGFHVTALPEEALEHCDAVVKGEAENVIARVIADADAGKLQGIYENQRPPDLRNLPVPRYDLIRFDHYMLPFSPVHGSRGCPNNCDFCAAPAFYGKKYRKRPIPELIRDIKAAGPIILLVDHNLTADRNYALSFFAALRPLQKLWIGLMNLSVGNDPELLQAAADSGCIAAYIGIETLDPRKLQSVNKTANLNISPEDAIRQFKRYHIEPFVSMMIGFESDTPAVSEEIVNFCNRAKIPALMLYIMTPPPASPLYFRLQTQGVPIKKEWHLYNGTHSVYPTSHMPSETIEQVYAQIYKRVYSFRSILQRTLFPPHLVMMLLNLTALRQNLLGDRLHPWMGIRRPANKAIDWSIPTFFTLMQYPLVKKISRLLRFWDERRGKNMYHSYSRK